MVEAGGEVLDGVWRFVAVHPGWIDESDGWEAQVAWWAVCTADGVVLIDPLVSDWDSLDRLIETCGGCAAIVRTDYWHQRSVAAAAARYGAEIWARSTPPEVPVRSLDRSAQDGEAMTGGLVPYDVLRADEIAVWLPAQGALVFGDLLVRSTDGELILCPDHWIEGMGGPDRARNILRGLPDLAVEHVLVSHGPLVIGNGTVDLNRVSSD